MVRRKYSTNVATVCLHGSARGALTAAVVILRYFVPVFLRAAHAQAHSHPLPTEGNETANEGPNPPGLLLGQQTGEELLLFDATGLISASFPQLHPLDTGALCSH